VLNIGVGPLRCPAVTRNASSYIPKGEQLMTTKRAKKRFQSNVNVIEFQQFQHTQQTNLPQKKQRVHVVPRNPNQEEYLQKLHDQTKNIVFAIGPAGTGKTLLACQVGIKLFKEGLVDKIVITRPAVSVDEDLGFLPGTLQEKMAPWTRPIMDVFSEYYNAKDLDTMIKEGVIEISPLAYMRGRTFKNSYIIADEMQNATQNQMKMLLTRLGEGSKMIVTGDLKQADRLDDNGLIDFCNLLADKKCQHIDIQQFTMRDIERHRAVKEVLKIYGD
jgi:phosphate starvation-inducible PhoH-like protein